MHVYIYICIERETERETERDRESNHDGKNNIYQKFFRLASLSIYCIYISFKTVTQNIFYSFYSWFETKG